MHYKKPIRPFRTLWILPGMFCAQFFVLLTFLYLYGNSRPAEGKTGTNATLNPPFVMADVHRFSRNDLSAGNGLDIGEAFGPELAHPGQMIMIIFLFSLSSTLTVFFLIKRKQSRFYREIYHKEREKKTLLEHFGYIKQHANDPIFLVAPDGSIVDINRRALQIYGYPEEEMLKLRIEDIRAPEKRAELVSEMEKVAGSNGYMFETLHIKKDGTVFPVEISARYIELDGQNYYHSIVRDISERKLTEHKIRELDKYNKLILESAGEGIIGIGKFGNIEFINKAGADMLGFSPDEIRGRNSHNILHHMQSEDPEHNEEECYIYKSLKNGTALNVPEDRFIRKDGSLLPVEYTTNPITEKGIAKGCVLVFRDISEKKLIEEQIILSREIAEESSKLKSAILMNMSHELRTPLNGILGFAQLLIDKLKGTPEEPMVSYILESGDRLLNTLTNILDLAQLESDETRVEIEEHDLKTIIEELTNRYEPMAGKKNLFLNNNLREDYLIRADRNMLIQSLGHIIDNAIKFTETGGIIISSDQVGENGILYTRIHITDTGIGIPEKEVYDIFTEFHQISQGYRRQYEGSGIGLSLVRKMIVLMKGEISLESKPGKGSTFIVSLPSGTLNDKKINEKAGTREESSKPINSPAIKIPNVLVVEDNAINAQLIAAYLDNSVSMEHAADGNTALKMALRKQYDIVLMDINLGPGIDGLETIRRLRRIAGYELIPVIAVTGYTMAEDKEKMLAVGCNHFLEKPFNQKQLKQLIEKVHA